MKRASSTPKLKWKNHPKVVLVFLANPGHNRAKAKDLSLL
jgi:hypothetical protein